MAHLTWSPRALDDLNSIAEFIGRDSQHYAAVFVRKTFETAERCAESPEAGSIVPEFDTTEFRERLIYHYRFLYRVVDNTEVEVVAIIHGARQLPPQLFDE